MAFLSRSVRVQYISNLHLDTYKHLTFSKFVTPAAPILCIAGNIGNPNKTSYYKFLEYCSDKWEHIFVVPGNRELYNNSPVSTLKSKDILSVDSKHAICNTICYQWSNIHFLNNTSQYLSSYNLNFIGTTLWGSQLQNSDSAFIAKGDKRPLSQVDTANWHTEATRFLDAKVFESEENRQNAIILTHYLPSLSLVYNRYLHTEHPIRAWIYGNMRDQKNTNVQEGEVIVTLNTSNPKAIITVPCGHWPSRMKMLLS
jgi:hypothetical protein